MLGSFICNHEIVYIYGTCITDKLTFRIQFSKNQF